jgi:folate-binding protein YgfZ
VTLSLARADDPVTTTIADRTVVVHYGDPAAEYGALRAGAIVVDRSHRHRLRLFGARAAETLTGLVTNDVQSLAPGRGQYAAALTPKGKIVADLRILQCGPEELLIDTPARAAAGWMGIMRRYVNPRLARYEDVSEATADVGVFGPRSGDIVALVLGVDRSALETLDRYSHLPVGDAGLVARVPELGIDGFEMIIPREELSVRWPAIVGGGARPAGLAAWEVARIEAGRPEWGLDIDETTIPQEANFDDLQAISYTKGCYTGQEVVARVHFRGHVNRHLRGLRFVCRDAPPRGAQLFAEGDKPVGDVRSAALSPRLGGVALAMVRREVPLGATVSIRWSEGDCQGGIAALPLPS